MLDLAAMRDELAAGLTAAGVIGYARPPGQVAAFPAAVVQDPATVVYRQTAGKRASVDLVVRVIVGRAAAQDATIQLDELVSPGSLPAAIEQIAVGSWLQIAVIGFTGGYSDFVQGGQVVGVAADLDVQLRFTP